MPKVLLQDLGNAYERYRNKDKESSNLSISDDLASILPAKAEKGLLGFPKDKHYAEKRRKSLIE